MSQNVRLCGFPPFYHENNEVLFEIIKKGEFHFPSPAWDGISQEGNNKILITAKSLIKGLLTTDPK